MSHNAQICNRNMHVIEIEIERTPNWFHQSGLFEAYSGFVRLDFMIKITINQLNFE